MGDVCVFVSHALAGFLSQSPQPAAHVKPQAPPLQDGVAFCDGHGVHSDPQVATSSFDTHAAPHAWNPGLHVQPHAPAALHVAVALAGAAQGVQDDPHVAGSALLAHAPPHA